MWSGKNPFWCPWKYIPTALSFNLPICSIGVLIYFLILTKRFPYSFFRFWADPDSWKEIDYSVRQFFFIFACTNSCVNPLIYGAFTDRKTGLFVSKERLCFMQKSRNRIWRVSTWIEKYANVCKIWPIS